MATSEARRNLSQNNRTLRQQYTRLKIKKEQITEHLSTLLRRSKQMQALRNSLTIDLSEALNRAKIQRNKKSAYIGYLQGDIKKLQDQLMIVTTEFKKLEGEYQVCLQDYDEILKMVTEQIELCKIIQADIDTEKETCSSMKAMIFDYQRLKRVLQEQRKYFKQLSCTQEKSHQERVKQLEKILEKLTTQQKQSQNNLKLFKFRSAFFRLDRLFKKKVRKYAQFLRYQLVFFNKSDLGIKVFKNCIQVANLKHKLTTRKLFRQWHDNVFPKLILRNLVEETMKNDRQSFKKLMILNKMTETIYDRNLAIFHLYQKGKYLSIIANKVARKDAHYGFNKWRQTYQKKTQLNSRLLKLVGKTIPKYHKRLAFKLWRNNSATQTRLILANHLLNEYLNTRELSRMFRKWRLQLPRYQLKSIDQFLYNVKLRNKILSRINYEKRKSKALTTLAFKLQKIKLRNYFIKYWANIKGMTIQKEKVKIGEQKSKFSSLRVQHKDLITRIQNKNKKTSLKVFRVFMMNSRLRPTFKKWRNTMLYFRKRSQTIFSLALRKQQKIKLYVMNQFRKCVQYFEKKQMHQVLTDLNNKMQAINEKSTNFRQRLKKCIQDLGIMASKKIDYIFNYSIMCQGRVYFITYIRKKIRKLYRQYIIYRFNFILNKFGEKKGFNELALYSRDRARLIKFQAIQKKYSQDKVKKLIQNIFYTLKGFLNNHKSSFKLMGHSENIIMFYRMASAFVALQRKRCAQKIKSFNKKISSNQAILKTKLENIDNLQDQKRKLQQNLKNIFIKFIGFQDRNMNIKQKNNIFKLTKRYFDKYRQNVQERIYNQKVILHFADFISQKDKMIFWKGANAIRYQNSIALVKQQLAKLNKKKKSFEQKNQKGRGDISKRLTQSEKVHIQNFQYYDYYLKKFENTLKFYQITHQRKQNSLYKRQIFKTWRRQYKGAKGLAQGVNKVLQRNLVQFGCQQIIKFVKKAQSQLKSQYLCATILQRKGINCMKDCILLWRCNIRRMKCDKIQVEINEMIESRQQVAVQCKVQGVLVANQRLRLRKKKIMANCFMLFKNQITQKKYEQKYIVRPFREKVNQRYLRDAIKQLKWNVFFQKTQRAYLKYKKDKFERQLKSDVFLTLKIYRKEHYTIVNRMQGCYDNIKHQYLRFALDKILNLGAYNRDELNYQRRRALRHIVMNKVTKVYLIKRKLMTKWHAWLIPRTHYLPNILKNLQITALRRYFANIREHAYWNPIYIKKAADNITSQGYSQINAATNNLVKEGYDPQQIKEYLTTHNQKDTKIIKQVISRIKVWGSKQDLVRAWNSWKQYLVLKSKIRRSLTKIINIVRGLGKYWNRWRSKDPKFNAMLQKQSRGNMLERYRDLGRLLKQYKRDVKDSKVYCQQLKQVNDQYAQKNDEGIRMALSAISNNLKKGMKQGLYIWRERLRQHKKQILDQKYDQLSQGISILVQQKNKLRYRLIAIQEQNKHMKQKCILGKECGQILQKLLRQRDNLSIDLADKEHNLKLLLEDNLRLKQKIRSAKQNAQKLISKVQNFQNVQ